MYWDGKYSHEVATALSCGREPTVRNAPGLSSHGVATAIPTAVAFMQASLSETRKDCRCPSRRGCELSCPTQLFVFEKVILKIDV